MGRLYLLDHLLGLRLGTGSKINLAVMLVQDLGEEFPKSPRGACYNEYLFQIIS